MTTTDDLDDARVAAALGRILSAGDPYTGLPLLDPATKLLPPAVVDALLEPIVDQKGAAEGIAELDAEGLVPADQIPVQAIADDPILTGTFVAVEGEPSDGDAIVWDETAGEWVPAPVAGGGGGAVDSVNAQTGVVVLEKGDIGLGNVDNTSDADKPVSTAQATALAGKAATAHTHAQGDVTGLSAALAAAVPKTLVDAKGDLIVATANDTPARLAVGTNGHVLTADSAEASGVKWAAPGGGGTTPSGVLVPLSGWAWDFQNDFGVDVSFSADGDIHFVPIVLSTDCTIDGIYTRTRTTAGSSGSIIRCGVYDSSGPKGTPGDLISQGTMSGEGVWDFIVNLSAVAVPAGLYWAAFATQGAPTTRPVMGGMYKTGKTPALASSVYDGHPPGSLRSTGITGPFAATWSGTLTYGPREAESFALRVA